jgi:type I restriction enzyme, R subunit
LRRGVCGAAHGDAQVDFKGKAKAFVRTYGFLATILPYTDAGWERLSTFLNFLIPKLPAPVEEDLSKGMLDAIDMDSYRVEKRAVQQLQLADAEATIDPVPAEGGGGRPEAELDRLSSILRSFNDHWGNIAWSDGDRVRRLVSEDIPRNVEADPANRNARRYSDKQNARIENDEALRRVVVGMMKDDTDLFRLFQDNPGFKRWLADAVFEMTYRQPPP